MTKEDKNRFLVSTPSSLIVWTNTNGRCNKRNMTKRNEKIKLTQEVTQQEHVQL
jgi:hypothetical protein